MAKSWKTSGSLAPLFDRLTDENPLSEKELTPLVNYNREQILRSISGEVETLLNTRCKLSWKEYQELHVKNLTYGIPALYGFPDQSYGDASNSDGAQKLGRLMANSIRIFEPRLSDVEVSVDRFDQANQDLHLNVQALVEIDTVQEPFSFSVSIQGFQGIGKKERRLYDSGGAER